MATPDMDVIKEIPGYKVILKAILKSQIQQLVEQLASCTDEESVILTASVSDGTLSHLGSDSGKFFLDDHEDIKSQFLGFCLKRHHRKKMEKEREEAMKNVQVAAPQYGMRSPSNARQGYMQRSPRMVSPRQQGSQMFSRSTTNPGVRGQLRQEPYTLTRPKRTSLTFDNQGPGGSMHPPPATSTSAVVKIEPDTDNDSAETSGESTSQTPSQGQVEVEREDDAKSNSSTSTIPNDLQDVKFSDTQQVSGLVLDSDLSNLIGENSQQSNSNDNMLDAESGLAQVKKEAVDDLETDLEITGVEPGRPIPPPQPQEMWGVNSPGGFEQSGAAGSSGDMAGYSKIAMSRAEIQRRYRERKKAKEGKKYLEKEAARVRKYYVKSTDLHPFKLEQRRQKTRKCMRKKRSKEKEGIFVHFQTRPRF